MYIYIFDNRIEMKVIFNSSYTCPGDSEYLSCKQVYFHCHLYYCVNDGEKLQTVGIQNANAHSLKEEHTKLHLNLGKKSFF